MENNSVMHSNGKLPMSHPLQLRETLYIMFDMLLAEQDIRSLYCCSMINHRWRDLIMVHSEKYFNNYYNVATIALYNQEKCVILQESILDLLLVKLGIAPNKRDISNMVSEANLFRISSLEDINMPLCLDELIPDEHNGQTYVCRNETVMRTTINEILVWLRDYLFIDLFPTLGKLEMKPDFHVDVHIWAPIEDALDDFYYYFLEISDSDVDKWSDEYERYTNDDALGSHKITHILNKIKIIYTILDIFGSHFNKLN